MQPYRLYFMNEFGHIDRVENIHAADDVRALEQAQSLVAPQPIEIWCDTRKVTRVETPVTAMLERYRAFRRTRVMNGAYAPSATADASIPNRARSAG